MYARLGLGLYLAWQAIDWHLGGALGISHLQRVQPAGNGN